jgi:hypothetical protein
LSGFCTGPSVREAARFPWNGLDGDSARGQHSEIICKGESFLPDDQPNWGAFQKALTEPSNGEARAAYDKLLAAGAHPGLLQIVLRRLFVEKGLERKREKLRTAVAQAKKAIPQYLTMADTDQKLDRTIQDALQTSSGLGQPEPSATAVAVMLRARAVFLTGIVDVYGKNASKKSRGTVKDRDYQLAVLVQYLERLTGKPHYEEVACLVRVAARVSGSTDIPVDITADWVRIAVARFRRKYPEPFAAVERNVAKYIRTKRREASLNSSTN